MIKSSNERLTITLSKSQAKWLKTNAKKLGMTTSKFVKFLMDKNIAKFLNMLPPDQLEYMIKIAKTPWLDLFDEDEFK